MNLKTRHKLSIIPVMLYWLFLFILTHIPNPSAIIRGINVSDKTMHFIAYLCLVFLLWFALGSSNKVNWRKISVWLIILIMACYGAVDEWLQGFVHRTPDILDFFADMAGVLTGLIMLSIFSFTTASLIVTAGAIFILTKAVRTVFNGEVQNIILLLHLIAYAVLSVLWIQFLDMKFSLKAPRIKWLISALTAPISLMIATALFSKISGNKPHIMYIMASAAGVAAVAMIYYFAALFRQRLFFERRV